MAGRQHSRTSSVFLIIKPQNTFKANCINLESGSTIYMNFIWIGSRARENQTRLFLLFESEFFGENMVLRPTSSSAVTTATIHLPIQIWLFLFIPQITYLHTKNEEGLKIFTSNFAPLFWRIALKPFYKLYQKGDELMKKHLTLVANKSFLIHQNDCLKSLSAGDIFSCEEK